MTALDSRLTPEAIAKLKSYEGCSDKQSRLIAEAEAKVEEMKTYFEKIHGWTNFMDKTQMLMEVGYHSSQFEKDESYFIEYLSDDKRNNFRVESSLLRNKKGRFNQGDVVFFKKRNPTDTVWEPCSYVDMFVPLRQNKSGILTITESAFSMLYYTLEVEMNNARLRDYVSVYAGEIDRLRTEMKAYSRQYDKRVEELVDLKKQQLSESKKNWLSKLLSVEIK